jgi:hypothetical protein
MLKWLRYSGACVILTVNPLHWKLLPWLRRESNLEWPGPNEHTWAMGFLFVTVRVWLDDGSW